MASAALVVNLLVAAKASASPPHAGSVNAVSIVSPATDTAIGPNADLPVTARIDGHPRSVAVSIGGHSRPMSPHRGRWTATVPGTWLSAGANKIEVAATSRDGGTKYSYRSVYRQTTAANLGLRVVSADSATGRAVHVTSTQPVAMVTGDLNGHDLTARLYPGILDQIVALGGDEGVQRGRNLITLTAVSASGTYQQVRLAFSVANNMTIAAATTNPGVPDQLPIGSLVQASTRTRVGNSVTLDASASSGAHGLTYQWRVAQAPAGSTSSVSHPTSIRPSFTPDRPGRYVLAVTVRGRGATASSDSTTLTVTPTVAPIGEPVVTQAPGGIYVNGVSTPPASGQPLVLHFLDRGSLVPLGSVSGGSTAASVQAMLNQLNAVTASSNSAYSGDGIIAILSSPGGYQCTPIAGACAVFEQLLQQLNVDDVTAPKQNDVTVHSGLPFSTITVTTPLINLGSTANAVWRSSQVPAFPSPLLPGVAVGAGNLSGYFEFPQGDEPAMYVNDTNQPFTTSVASTPTTNTMQLGECLQRIGVPPTPGMPACQQLDSRPLTTCAGSSPTGGFQVAVLWAASLSVITNQTFTTNSGCGSDGVQNDAAQLTAMASAIAPYVASGGTKDYLVIVQSIGSPRPQTAAAAVNQAWTALGTNVIVPLGGTGSIFDFLGFQSGYALVGYSDTALPGFGAPFAPEASTDSPHVSGKALPAVINGVFSRNHRNDYYPQSYAPLTGSALDGFANIVTRPASPWPAEDTAGELKAWEYLTSAVVSLNGLTFGPNLGSCWGIDNYSIRDIYCDLPRSSLTLPSATYVPGHGFTQPEWTTVRNQFSVELHDVAAVNTMLTILAAPFGDGTNNTVDFKTLVKAILAQVNVPVVGPTHSPWSFWLGLFADAVGLIAGFVGVPDGNQLAGAIVNGIGQGLGITSQLIPDRGGSAQSQLDQRVKEDASNVASDMNSVYANVQAGIQSLQPILVTDFGKLTRAANLTLLSTDETQYEYSIKRATQAWAAPLLLSSAFAPDSLTSEGAGINSSNTFANGPYPDDAANYSCSWYTTDQGINPYAPFASPPAGSQYLAGSPTQRYILATPGNPSTVGQTSPRTTVTPDLPPAGLLGNMFAPVTGPEDVTHLGLVQAHTFTRDFGLGSGTAVTCPLSPGLPTGGIAATSTATGDREVFYTFADNPGTGSHALYVDNGDPTSATWHGPTKLPGTPDQPTDGTVPLAAGSSGPGSANVFFLQKGKLVNDYLTSSGWQGPAQLPGTPDNINDGGLIATAFGAGFLHVFFWQGNNIVYDYFVPGTGWVGPVTAVANATQSGNGETPLAAASFASNSLTVFYQTFNYSTSNIVAATSTNGSPWTTATVAANADQGSPLAASTDSAGHVKVLYTSGSNGSQTTLLASTGTNASSWSAPVTVAGSLGYPLAAITLLSPAANDVEAYLVPPNGDSHNVIDMYQWSPSSSWQAQPILPVPWLRGQY